MIGSLIPKVGNSFLQQSEKKCLPKHGLSNSDWIDQMNGPDALWIGRDTQTPPNDIMMFR
ncbi:hypothetical protein EHQ95_04620 [Leptospira vanthielii]|uniref:Uncharacterized protein n=1 Tax=Leptospira vanthielii TaxID=293085 RepID=A0ABY2NQG6_9LEPT|nr:hypothetical protein EHQ95_04620 [Leptospira vanthielii]